MTADNVRDILRDLPGVEEGPCYGSPGFRVRKKLLARLWEDGQTLVVRMALEERDFRLRAEPEVFFLTDHYRAYDWVLVRLPVVAEDVLREVLESAWTAAAPTSLIAARAAEGRRS